MRVVFDTNIFISALVFPGGKADAAMLRILEEEDRLVLSRPVLREILDVLARKFERDPEELARVAVFVADLAEMVAPEQRIDVMSDAGDNRVLECALAGRADAIVTGDAALLRLGTFAGVRLLSMADYLAGDAAGGEDERS